MDDGTRRRRPTGSRRLVSPEFHSAGGGATGGPGAGQAAGSIKPRFFQPAAQFLFLAEGRLCRGGAVATIEQQFRGLQRLG